MFGHAGVYVSALANSRLRLTPLTCSINTRPCQEENHTTDGAVNATRTKRTKSEFRFYNAIPTN